MSLSEFYRVSSPDVVSDLVQDEVVIVDLNSGSYYTLDGVGALVWSSLENGMDVATTFSAVGAVFNGSESEIADAVTRLIGELRAENLIVPVEMNPQAPASHPSQVAPSEKKEFVAPVLYKYTDMQELLLVDPVHHVDAQGWPLVKNRGG